MEFTVLELQAMQGALTAGIAMIEQADMQTMGMRIRKASMKSALKKISEELKIRKVLTGKAGA